MSHVAWSVCLCVLGTRVSCAETAEPIDMPSGGMTHVGPRNHVIDGGGLDPPRKWAILGVVRPTEKHWESLAVAVYAAEVKMIIQSSISA